MSELLGYFAAEKQAGALLVALGLAGAGLAAYLLAARSPLRAMAWPLLVFVLIQLSIGAVLLLRTDAQVAALEEGLRTDRAATVTVERTRMERVNRSFRVFEALEVVLILAGLALALFLRRNPIWSAVGMGLLVEAAIMLVFDLFAEHRALVYTRWLESLTGGS